MCPGVALAGHVAAVQASTSPDVASDRPESPGDESQYQ